MDLRHRILLASGGAIAAVTLLGGAVMAQTPDPSPTPAPSAPAAPGAPSTQTPPDTGAQPGTPGQRGARNCPDEGAATQSSTGLWQTPRSRQTAAAPQF